MFEEHNQKYKTIFLPQKVWIKENEQKKYKKKIYKFLLLFTYLEEKLNKKKIKLLKNALLPNFCIFI